MKAVAVVYKPVGLLVGIAGGMPAGAVFSQVRKLVAHDDDSPAPPAVSRRPAR